MQRANAIFVVGLEPDDLADEWPICQLKDMATSRNKCVTVCRSTGSEQQPVVHALDAHPPALHVLEFSAVLKWQRETEVGCDLVGYLVRWSRSINRDNSSPESCGLVLHVCRKDDISLDDVIERHPRVACT